ncbi:hypothetical protein Hanom_Chr16g01433931 [Helianthus anomalus]
MGRELERGLGTNAQVTTPGGLGFPRGPLGGGFQPGRWAGLAVFSDQLSFAGLARILILCVFL